MPRDRGQPQSRGRAGPGALLILFAVVAVAVAAPVAAGAGDGQKQRRDNRSAVSAPKRPVGTPRTARSHARGLRLARRSLLAGRPGQRLGVRIRFRQRRLPGVRRVRLRLVRIRRRDPRHPGKWIGGETAARAKTRLRDGRGRVRLRGLDPQPGPHRLLLRGPDGNRLAAARIDVLPQSLRPGPGAGAGREAARADAASGSRGSTPKRLSLGSGSLVNQDLSFRPGSEASSAVAVDGDDPDRAIAATDDFGSGPVAFVSNRGLAAGSVGRRAMPGLAELAGTGGEVTGVDPCCDPAVAADDDGDLWIAAAASGDGGRIVVNRIAPGTTSFAGVSAGLPVAAGSTAQEKPTIAALTGDRVAAAWIETLGGVQNVVYSECDLSGGAAGCDDPDAWSAPVALTAASGLYSMPSVAISPAGAVYVAWWNPGAANAIEIDRCLAIEDCATAAAWNEDAKVADLDSFDDDGVGGPDPLPMFCPIIGAPGGLVNPSPTVAVDGSDRVYVAYSDLRDNPDPGDPSRCTASGSDKTFDAFVAASPAPGVLPAANSGVRLSDDGPLDLNDHFLPALSVDRSTGEVEASFYTTREDPGGQHATRVYVASSDSGQSYSAPVTVSTGSSRFSGPLSDGIDYGDRQGAAAAGGRFLAAWTDNRPQQSRDPDLYALTPEVETTIDSGPSGTVPSAASTFTFSTAAPRLECRRDDGVFRLCRSPEAIGPLGNGGHQFSVRASDRAGNPMDLSPATATWTVADHDPPETRITHRPRNRTKKRRPRFEFAADEEGARFECRYDREPWSRCTNPKRAKVTVGRHRFRVRATDVGGNVDPTPATDRFKRKAKCPKRKRRRGRC